MTAKSISFDPISLGSQSEYAIIQFERIRQVKSLNRAELDQLIRNVPIAEKGAVISECARIDLERSYDQSNQLEVSPFLEMYPEVFTDQNLRHEVAFEHYRLSHTSGEQADTLELAERYQVPPLQLRGSFVGGQDDDKWTNTHSKSSSPKLHNEQLDTSQGKHVCGYPVLLHLGEGAFGKVYLARQPDLAGRLVVLKVTNRLTTESDQLARLQHSNIVPVYSVHSDANGFCICMPFLGAMTLADLIKDRNQRPQNESMSERLISTVISRRVKTLGSQQSIEEAVGSTEKSNVTVNSDSELPQSFPNGELKGEEIFSLLGLQELTETIRSKLEANAWIDSVVSLIIDVTDGVAHAHRNGIIHRDLKPENILIANDGRPIVLDFNLAASDTAKESAIVGGTIPYMSPQQIRALTSGKSSIQSDDVFSIGTILYQLLAGRLPFENLSVRDVNIEDIAKTKEKLPASPRSLNSKIPSSLESIVMKCLRPEPVDRYSSAIELHEDLVLFRQHRVLKYAADRSPVERVQKFVRRHPTLTSATFLAAVSAAIVISLLAILLINVSQLNRTRAYSLSQSLERDLPDVIMQLQEPRRTISGLKKGLSESGMILAKWNVGHDKIELGSPLYRLSDEKQQMVRENLSYLLYTAANANANLALLSPDSIRSELFSRALDQNQLAQRIDNGLSSALNLQARNILAASGQDVPEVADSEFHDTSDRLLARSLIAREKMDLLAWKSLSQQHVQQSATDPIAWFNLGAFRFASGDFSQALAAFDVSARLQDSGEIATLYRGVCAFELGQLDQAKADFEACLRWRPDWDAARYDLALVHRALGENESAMEQLRSITQSGEAGPRVWIMLSRLELLSGNRDRARECEELAMSTTPRDADDWCAVGIAQLANDPDTAFQSFQNALSIDPSNIAALQNSSHVLAEYRNEHARAIEFLDRLVGWRPNQADVFASRGILHARNGNVAAAIRDAATATEKQPSAIAKLQIAGIYSIVESLQKAPSNSNNSKLIDQDGLHTIAMFWLKKALLENPAIATIADNDRDLVGLKADDQFQTLIAAAKLLSTN